MDWHEICEEKNNEPCSFERGSFVEDFFIRQELIFLVKYGIPHLAGDGVSVFVDKAEVL